MVVALWWSVPARAVDLDALVVAWTNVVQGQGGTDGVDRATGVAIDSAGNAIASGFVDGAPDHGRDGYAVSWAPDGTVVWDEVVDAGPIGADRTSSDDGLFGVTVEPLTDQVALCGRSGASTPTDPTARYHVEAHDASGAPPPVLWQLDTKDGTTDVQQCDAVAWAGGSVYSAGWSLHTDGRWLSYRIDEALGEITLPLFGDFGAYLAVPDMAHGVAVRTVTGQITLAGEIGQSGLDGSDGNDTDWHVVSYDVYGNELWEDTFDGGHLLEDRAMAVAVDQTTGDLYVAGYENGGDDNAAGADDDWVVIRYSAAGDGAGGPERVWEARYESASGASERATGIALDENGDVLVAGTTIDSASGVDRWRVAKLSAYDGTELQSWIGDAHAGDSAPTGVAYRDHRVAISGTIDDGAGDGDDFAVIVLEGDQDGDGAADSVDPCDDDPAKIDPGYCGCNVPDEDTDGDGVLNCLEECASDPNKQDAGVCGCGKPDDDTDGDGTADCDDRCPTDPNKASTVGECGCGAPDDDSDGDGVIGCHDACSNTPEGAEVNEFGCPIASSTGDTAADAPPPTDTSKGCGCSGAPSGALGGPIGLLALALVQTRRRRSA